MELELDLIELFAFKRFKFNIGVWLIILYSLSFWVGLLDVLSFWI